MVEEWMNKDLYGALGVDPSARLADITKAYRQQARKNHPDLNPGDSAAEERFKLASEAYTRLSDQASRDRYDSHLAATGQPYKPQAKDFLDVFPEDDVPASWSREATPKKHQPRFDLFEPKQFTAQEMRDAVKVVGAILYQHFPDQARKYAEAVSKGGPAIISAGREFEKFEQDEVKVRKDAQGNDERYTETFKLSNFLEERFHNGGQRWTGALNRAVMAQMCAAGAVAGESYAKTFSFFKNPTPWLEQATLEKSALVKAAGLMAPNRPAGFDLLG